MTLAHYTCPDCGVPYPLHTFEPDSLSLVCPEGVALRVSTRAFRKAKCWRDHDGGRVERRKRWDANWPKPIAP